MHDLDRVQLERQEEEEWGYEFTPEYEEEEEEETETDQFLGNILKGALGGSQQEEEEEEEFSGELDEVQELQLASELLEVSNEEELQQFLGDLLRKAAGGVAKFARSPQGQALGGAVKKDVTSALKQTALGVLPKLGGAIGGYWGGGGGERIGQALGTAAKSGLGQFFGMELEGLSNEDREFEVAKRFVRFATSTARNAARYQGTAPPRAVVRRAITTAARDYAPGLVAAAPALASGPIPSQRDASGRWERNGSTIVLHI
jgi:hypothetical protein